MKLIFQFPYDVTVKHMSKEIKRNETEINERE